MYSSIITGAIHGIDSYLMRVETDLPSFNMVGFMSGEMREAGERVRVAFKNLGIHMPPQRITVNLSPAGIPKRGMVVDLPVSVGLLVCLGYIPEESVNNVLVAGELGLNGEIRPVKGILSIVMEAKANGISTGIWIPKFLNATRTLSPASLISPLMKPTMLNDGRGIGNHKNLQCGRSSAGE